jgi:hypothetical protein
MAVAAWHRGGYGEALTFGGVLTKRGGQVGEGKYRSCDAVNKRSDHNVMGREEIPIRKEHKVKWPTFRYTLKLHLMTAQSCGQDSLIRY